jgi:hypothetical protein
MSEILPAEITLGVDTHKDVHIAVAIDTLGARRGAMTIPVRTEGYRDVMAWARSLGTIRAFDVEGTGSYGAGLTRFPSEHGQAVFEVDRPNRQIRRRRGKSDPIDAEVAARAVLGGEATALPRSGTGAAEMIRHLKAARDGAVEARSQPMLTIKAPIIGAPAALRQEVERISGKIALVKHLAASRPGANHHDGCLGQVRPARSCAALARAR